jgi:hypothetical protein
VVVVDGRRMDATSERVGSLIPPSCGGERESRERGKLWATGELKEVGGAEPEEYRETLSSQSLVPLPEWTEEAEETELRLSTRPSSAGSFLIMAIFDCLGLVIDLEGLRDFDLERNSSNLRGRGRR